MFLLISYKAGEAKRIENRSVRHRLSSLFFSVQNNQLHNIAGYLYPNHALFILYFVQLDNKPINQWKCLKYTASYFSTCNPLAHSIGLPPSGRRVRAGTVMAEKGEFPVVFREAFCKKMQVKITGIFDYLSWPISAFPHSNTFDDNLVRLMKSHPA